MTFESWNFVRSAVKFFRDTQFDLDKAEMVEYTCPDRGRVWQFSWGCWSEDSYICVRISSSLGVRYKGRLNNMSITYTEKGEDYGDRIRVTANWDYTIDSYPEDAPRVF